MDTNYKISIFEKEIELIKNERYKENARILIGLLPDYFFSVPASSIGKYHPSFASGEAVKIACELFNDKSLTGAYTSSEKDLMILSLILHDGLKSGLEKSEFTRFDHPILVCNFIMDNKDKLTLIERELDFMCHVISSHMGPWNTSKYSDAILPEPESRQQKLVHMCDYLASRKFLDVRFNGNDIEDYFCYC